MRRRKPVVPHRYWTQLGFWNRLYDRGNCHMHCQKYWELSRRVESAVKAWQLSVHPRVCAFQIFFVFLLNSLLCRSLVQTVGPGLLLYGPEWAVTVIYTCCGEEQVALVIMMDCFEWGICEVATLRVPWRVSENRTEVWNGDIKEVCWLCVRSLLCSPASEISGNIFIGNYFNHTSRLLWV